MFDLINAKLVFFWGQMQEKFTACTVVQEEVEMVDWFEGGMQSYCVRVGAELDHALSLSELSHKGVVVCDSFLADSLQCQNASAHSASYKVHFTTCSLPKTDKKLEFRNA